MRALLDQLRVEHDSIEGTPGAIGLSDETILDDLRTTLLD